MSRYWIAGLRKPLALSCAFLLATAGLSRAGDNDAELRSLLEQQGKQIEELKRQLEHVSAGIKPAADAGDPASPKLDDQSVKKIVSDYLKGQDTKKRADEAAAKDKANEEGYKVGTLLDMTARWDPANGVRLETPNKDFTNHFGFRFQLDSVWFDQNANLRPASQVNNLQDGTFFRRIRPSWDGNAWEVLEWNCELALEQIQQSVINVDELWAGITKIPYLGTVRIGHQKVPQGFEGDQVSSSKAMTFLERAAYTDAFYENFATGLWTGNSVLDQHLTWAAMWYRQDNAINGNNAGDFQDGAYGYSGRLTALPIYENDGRCLLHLGVSGTWRNAEKPDATVPPNAQGGLVGPRVVRLRARPEMRDAIGDFGNNATGLPGNSVRWVDTGNIPAASSSVLGTELFYVLGPLSLQAEWAVEWVNAPTVGGRPHDTLSFNGGYVQISYFLTGENRAYDRRLGREASTYIARPFTPFWAVRAEDGRLSWGPGAWELAARWSRVNLNDDGIQGGVLDGVELGVNWYLNTNFKVQFEYLHNNRYHKGSSPAGTIPGNVDAFGIRTQLFF